MNWKIYGRTMKCMTSIAENVIVVGGGAAGMIAAIYAAENCKNVILIEKNKMLGRKLRITGKGRCNITNSADISDFIDMVPGNGTFLYSAFYSFTNEKNLERTVVLSNCVCYFEGLKLINAFANEVKPRVNNLGSILANIYLIFSINAMQYRSINYLFFILKLISFCL